MDALVVSSGEAPINVFESGAILLYLAEKFGCFLPKGVKSRTEVMNWLFWLQGTSLGGGFGHLYVCQHPHLNVIPLKNYNIH